MMGNNSRAYLIWSIEHDAWWRPGRMGYTRELAEAGRYDHDEARTILRQANLVETNECLIPTACCSSTHSPDRDSILALCRLIRDDVSGDALTASDRAHLTAIEEAPDQVSMARMIHHYYSDLDRANRTPRVYLYMHLGAVVGILFGEGLQ